MKCLWAINVSTSKKYFGLQLRATRWLFGIFVDFDFLYPLLLDIEKIRSSRIQWTSYFIFQDINKYFLSPDTSQDSRDESVFYRFISEDLLLK